MISNRFIAETLSGAVEKLDKGRAKRREKQKKYREESRTGGGDEGKGFLFLSP